MTFDFYTLNAIRWRDTNRRRLVDIVTLLVEQHKRKGKG